MGISLDELNNGAIYLEATDTLARRIDFAWSVYSHKTHYSDAEKKKALGFLVYAFDITDVEEVNAQLIELMTERNVHKAKNPEYIPGKQLTRLPFDPRSVILTAIDSQDSINVPHGRGRANAIPKGLTRAFKSAELLDVNVDSKIEDDMIGVTLLSEAERAAYRVNIRNGIFQKDGENFDTSEMGSHLKLGFGAFTLNANGELSVFNHQGYQMLHSSMNAGAPVVAAGELKIEDGVLISITTHSGHYMPSLFNVYRLLEYFASHNVDIKQANVITFMNPSEVLPGVSSRVTPRFPDGETRYVTDAVQVYQAMNKLVEKNIQTIQADITAYQSAGYYKALLQLKDEKMKTDLTEQRSILAQEFVEAIQDFKATLPEGLSKSELKEKLQALDDIISGFQERNETLSLSYHKNKSSGRLEKKMQDFRAQLQTLKAGDDDNLDSDIASDMKKLR